MLQTISDVFHIRALACVKGQAFVHEIKDTVMHILRARVILHDILLVATKFFWRGVQVGKRATSCVHLPDQ